MKLSIRVLQTSLFVLVALVAMLPLYLTLLPSIRTHTIDLIQSKVSDDLDFFSKSLPDDLKKAESRENIQKEGETFAKNFRLDLWIYDADNKAVFKSNRYTRPDTLLGKAQRRGIQKEDFIYTDLDASIVLVAKPVIRGNDIDGLVIVADNGEAAAATIEAAQTRLTITFVIALAIASLLGFAFSEAIRVQVQKLRRGAFSIAQGNFDLRLERGLVPDEMAELVRTFNVMAAKLGDAFQAIRSQQKQILTVINTMGEGLIEIGPDRTVNLANPSAARLLGDSMEQLIGSKIEDITDNKELIKSVDNVLKGKEITAVYEHSNSVFLVHGTTIREPGDKSVKGGVILLRDFTRQQELERAQRDFITNASHELRTPVSSLKGYAELLMGGAKDEKKTRDKFLSSIQVEADHLHRLVEDLFTLSRIDSKVEKVDIEKHPVSEIAQDVLTITYPLAKSNGVKLTVDLNTDTPHQVLCDRQKIVQVLSGFVENAVKYTPKGGTVTIFAKPGKRGVSIGAKDSGVGIPTTEIDNIFDRFYSPAQDSKKRKGTGLGLSIAKGIIEAHGSKIEVSSSPDKGSTFWFDLESAA